MPMQPLWFKAKTYGWGWTPCRWQGWAVLALFCGMTAYAFIAIDRASHSASDTLIAFLPLAVFNMVMLIVICLLTGEKPRWRWGK